MLQAVIAAPGLQGRFRVSGMITVACAVTGKDVIDAHEEARKQVALADTVILTKSDLPEADAKGLASRIASLNAVAGILDANAPDFALDLDDTGTSGIYGATDELAAYEHEHDHHHGHGHHDGHHHHDVNRHSDTIEAFTIVHAEPIAIATVGMFIDLAAFLDAARTAAHERASSGPSNTRIVPWSSTAPARCFTRRSCSTGGTAARRKPGWW